MSLKIVVGGGKKGMTSGGWGRGKERETADWKGAFMDRGLRKDRESQVTFFEIAGSEKTADREGWFWGIAGARIEIGLSSRSEPTRQKKMRKNTSGLMNEKP